jgi:hypothetical protein
VERLYGAGAAAGLTIPQVKELSIWEFAVAMTAFAKRGRQGLSEAEKADLFDWIDPKSADDGGGTFRSPVYGWDGGAVYVSL